VLFNDAVSSLVAQTAVAGRKSSIPVSKLVFWFGIRWWGGSIGVFMGGGAYRNDEHGAAG
jgi:hypothetical protein